MIKGRVPLRPKFIPRAETRDVCVAAGRRGGLKNGKRTLPRVVRSIADIVKEKP